MTGYPSRQAGATLMGLLMTAALIGFFAYVGMKVVPIYIENYGVKAALKSLAEEETQGVGSGEIRSRLMKRLDMNNVDSVRPDSVEIKALGRSRVVSVNYEVRTRFYGNLYLLMAFNESTVLADN